ncbi:hypothetical protein FHS85_002898 [Rhodoligotrophos appendicifer]|uniref:hypothetical protein n=1 Tax=Rhodoligotrophos appendicifer TaxID=987056 RepID=UPI00118612CA|nr:hypothetical protein [Rhodoligotrophos appendicifer]
MTSTDQLLREIEVFADERQLSASTVARLAANDGKLIARLRAGGTVTLATAEKLREFMRSARAGGREAGAGRATPALHNDATKSDEQQAVTGNGAEVFP